MGCSVEDVLGVGGTARMLMWLKLSRGERQEVSRVQLVA